MKKLLIMFAVIGMICSHSEAIAQIPEPEFIGEVFVVRSDNQYRTLPKERATMRTAASAGMYLVGIGSVTTKMALEGNSSPLQLSNKNKYHFIVRAKSNDKDPLSIIRFFRMNIESGFKQRRTVEIAKNAMIGAYERNNRDYVDFQAKKYGEYSYLITATLTPGEYGITVDAMDDANMVIATFGVYDQIAEEEQMRQASIKEDMDALKLEAKKQKKAERKKKRE